MSKFLADKQINIIRGKVLAGYATKEEVLAVFDHLGELEDLLDNQPWDWREMCPEDDEA